MGGRRHRKKRNDTFPSFRTSLPQLFQHRESPSPRALECVVCDVAPPEKRYPLQVLVSGRPATVFVTQDTLSWVWSRMPSNGLAPLIALDDFGLPREWEESELSVFALFYDTGWWVDG